MLLKRSPELVNRAEEAGSTALAYAIADLNPSLAIIELLLQSGANYMVPGDRPSVHSILGSAILTGNVDVVKLLQKHGANLQYREAKNYTAMLHAVHGQGDRLPMVAFLLSEGVPLDVMSSYRETPIGSAYRLSRFSVVEALLTGGADGSPLNWTPLLQAVAVGTVEEVAKELATGADPKAKDAFGQTALEVAFLRGEIEKAELLMNRDADVDLDRLLHCALSSGNAAALHWLAERGADLEVPDFLGQTPLAAAAENGDVSMVAALLTLGALPEPALERISPDTENSNSVMAALLSYSPEVVLSGQDAHRVFLGLGEITEVPLIGITKEEYLAGRRPVEGRSNPEELTQPFRVAMIRAGVNAYGAKQRFGDKSYRPPREAPVWCAQRFGQSLTCLPDGRVILIAGEHEDSYDPDFCIYNDVFVLSPDGEIRIFGYPYSIFPPTDFHTATLVHDQIFIIGSLGYAEQRGGQTPVFRLDTNTYAIQRLTCSGNDPGWIHKHRATLRDDHIVVIETGNSAQLGLWGNRLQQTLEKFELDLKACVWRKV